METRKIYINDTAHNNVITLETDATTFGEVKAAAIAAGVDVEGKDWLEGLTKTTPTSDDSLLPTNVSYQGNITNDLVFVLTNTNKRIRSGAMSYGEMKAYIKTNGLAEAFAQKYGKSYTQGKTVEFFEFINAQQQKTVKKETEKTIIKTEKKVSTTKEENIDYKDMYNKLVFGVANLIVAVGKEVATDIDKAVDTIIKDKENNIPKSLNLSEEDIKKFK